MTGQKWHAKNIEEIFKILKTSKDGLKKTDVKSGLRQFGSNDIKEARKINTPLIFLRQLKSYFILILVLAATVSFLIGKTAESFLIFILVVATCVMGFVQEYRAEKAMRALKKLFVPKSKVIRNGVVREISSRKLVPGDIILLQAGDRVPADARLIELANLRVDESTLTGESTPVTKHEMSIAEDTELAEKKNMVFMGTAIIYGRAKAVVVETGVRTELGKIATLIKEKEIETPLQVKLTQFTKWFGMLVLLISISLFILGILRGEEIFGMFLLVTALSVAAVPEVLPTLITVTLSFGVHTMAKSHAIVRKMSAVETLGAVTVICTDKTGTLTSNEMTVRKIYAGGETIEVGGIGFEPIGEFMKKGKIIDTEKIRDLNMLFKISALCNDTKLIKNGSWNVIGDPTEGALTVLAAKANFLQSELFKSSPRIAELPFSSERKRMTTIHSSKNGVFSCTKGAPEEVIKICRYLTKDSKIKKLSEKDKKIVIEQSKIMAKEGLRVLALAYKKLPNKDFRSKSVERNLVFVGLVGMYDPPRAEVAEAIRTCRQAGIKVVMVTGDHLLTATSVAKEVGLLLDDGKILTGEELSKLKDGEFGKIVEDVLVYARVTPEHKLRIVKMLKKKGHVVAVTGDGVNDAPALKFSDIGVAMGMKGADVAKEASNVVLTDDNFATIVKAIEEGRHIYDNLRKFMRYLLAINLSEIFFVSITTLARLPLPLLPLQILWLNLVTDGPPALALSTDKKNKELMNRKPRNPRHGILHGMKLFLVTAGILALVTELSIFIYYLFIGSSIEKARTMAFTVAVMFQLIFVFNCRSENKSISTSAIISNKYLLLSVGISIAMQLIVIYTPFLQPVFGTTELGLSEWMIVLGLASSGLLLSPKYLIRTEEKITSD